MIKGVVAGAFDVYHPGYVKMLKEAKENCNVLNSTSCIQILL